jgi:hypothetical protein
LLGGVVTAIKKDKFKIEYTATVKGRAYFGLVKKEGEKGALSAATSLLSDLSTKMFMILSDDGTEIFVLENPHSSNPTFYSLKAIDP